MVDPDELEAAKERFENEFRDMRRGGHAVLAALAMGAMVIFQREVTLSTVAALLTIVGYSINDTIVVFDRIRENMRIKRGQDFVKLVDLSINETLSRTIVTSLTTLCVVLVLYFVGSEVTRDFAFALFVGVLAGTYSSIFIASPTLVIWQQLFLRKRLRANNAKALRGKKASKA